MKPPAQLEVAGSPNPRRVWTWLFAAAALLPIADGRNTVALAAWLAPVCLLRFSRARRDALGTGALYFVLVITRAGAFRGMIPIPGIFYYVFILVTGITAIIPYLLDRAIRGRIGGFLGTLVFPSSLVAVEYVSSLGPHGSWGSAAYSQSGNLPLLQSLSIFGLWGIVFLIGWFASASNALLETRGASPPANSSLVAFAIVCAIVVLLGGARLAFFPPLAKTVRIASLSPLKEAPSLSGDLIDKVIGGTADDFDIHQFDTTSSANLYDLLERSRREAVAGAEFVFWSEGAVYVRKQKESWATSRGSEFAMQHHVYLGMTLLIANAGQTRPIENTFILIDPAGTIAFKYLKSRPTPGPEADHAVLSDGRLRDMSTSFGRVSSAICFDTDFAPLIAQAGKRGVDIMLSPASDWAAIDPRHTQMAKFRAIEQGFNLVRQSNLGLSAAFDYEGSQLSSMDEFQSKSLALVSEVPISGVRTIYSRFGDWFAWLCVACDVLLAISLRKIRSTSGAIYGRSALPA
jgi:apolipoprotein N-acyltransferase